VRSKVKRGMADAFRRGDNIQPPGVGYRFVDLKEANGNLVTTHKNTIEKVVEIDPEAADWSRRGVEMIACEGKSAVDVARLFNEHKVRGKQTWPDSRVRQHYGRDKLIGKNVFRKTKQVTDQQTGKKKVITLPTSEWIRRDVPHLRVLSNELAETVKRKLGLGAESFGRKVKKKLEHEIANEDQKLKRLTDRLATLDDTHLDAAPALAVLNRGQFADVDDSQASMWGSIQPSPNATPLRPAGQSGAIVPLTYDRREAARRLRKSQPRSYFPS